MGWYNLPILFKGGIMVEMQEGYFVDNQGNVYSNRKFTKLTLIKQHKDAYGYLRVKLLGQTKKNTSTCCYSIRA